ncbi:MAG TPA: diguanylate cyclase, partial [Burkholderiaceae bacterium]
PARAAAPAVSPWEALADTHFQTITTANGLANEVVDNVAQDPRGFIWLGTQSGLVRWDGYRAQEMRTDADDARAEPPGMFAGPFVDAAGHVWIGTSSGIVARYDERTDRVDRWELPRTGPENAEVLQFAQLAPGRLLIATTRGVYRLDASLPGRPGPLSIVGGIGTQVVNSLAVDAGGRVWAGAHDGLWVLRPGSAVFVHVAMEGPVRPLTVYGPISGRVWLENDRGVFTLEPGSGVMDRVRALDAYVAPLYATRSGVVRVDDTHVWLGSLYGIVVLDEATGRVRLIRHEAQRADSLPADQVRGIFQDRQGRIWVATSDGVGVCDPSPNVVTTLSRAGGTFGFANLGPGRILLARDYGRERFSVLAEGRPATYGFMRGTFGEFVDLSGFASLPDGSMLVGTSRALFHFDGAGRLLARSDALRNVGSLRVDGNEVWAATSHGGLWRGDVARPLALARVDRPAPGDAFVVRQVGPRLGAWRLVGSYTALRLVNETTGAILPLSGEGPKDELPRVLVVAIVPGPDGRVWVATAGAGLYVLSPGSAPGRWHSAHLSTRTGLPNDNVDAVVFDASGTAWLSTDGGALAAVDPRTFAVRVLDRRDGATFGDYWAGAGIAASDGTVLFGSHQGVAVARPALASVRKDSPPTVLTSIQIGDAPRSPAAPADGLVVPADSHRFAVEFSSLDYLAPGFDYYRYRLDGTDEHWIDTDATHRQAAYTNLSPGRYQLRVQASSRAGAWGPELVVPVRVIPAWYQTWWARTPACVALLALATLVYALLTARLRRQRAALERAVDQRTQELRLQKELVDEKARALEAANVQLQRMSHTDALTGLHNRRYLTQCIDADVAMVLRCQEGQPADAHLSFLLVDLDHFKAVNDVHGHAAGDAVLREVAQRLRAVARDSDRLIRWGGEEFLLVARDTTSVGAGVLAERICEAMRAAPFEVAPGVRLSKTCSVGFAALPFFPANPRAAGWAEVVDVADHALYLAKAAGRDGWVGLAQGPSLAP